VPLPVKVAATRTQLIDAVPFVACREPPVVLVSGFE
jgi:hypothetical protein